MRIKLFFRYNDISEHFVFKDVRSLMSKYRRLNVPRVPDSLCDFAHLLHGFKPIKDYYKGSCQGSDGSTAVIFITSLMMNNLKETTKLFGDGTIRYLSIYKINMYK